MIETFEIVAKATADPSRVRILKLLENGELCVCQITAIMNLAPATVSKHLAALKNSGLAQLRRDGKWVYYRLAERSLNDHAQNFLALLRISLNSDPTIGEDRRMLALVNAVSLQDLCSQGRAALGPNHSRPDSSACCGTAS